MGLSEWIFGSTPGQQAGQAVKEVVTGLFEGVDKIIDDFHLSEEKALELRIKFKEQHLKAIELALQDVQSARQMQISNKSWWPGILSALALSGFFGVSYVLITAGLPSDMAADVKVLVNTLIGALIGYVSTVFTFWMGSSIGSQEKNALLHQSIPSGKES